MSGNANICARRIYTRAFMRLAHFGRIRLLHMCDGIDTRMYSPCIKFPEMKAKP